LQEVLSCLYDTQDPHQGLAKIHEILTTTFCEESMPITRSQLLRSARVCGAQKAKTHQAAISTFSEVFLQNHASSSRLLTGRKGKSVTGFLFPQAQSSAKPWSYEPARPWVK
jgi:hypothetical protein